MRLVSKILRRRFIAMTAALSCVVAIFFAGSMIPANAGGSDTVEASAAFHNGYFIDNYTYETLEFQYYVQPGGKECYPEITPDIPHEDHPPSNPPIICDVHGTGFGAKPPQTIAPFSNTAYFEIPVYLWKGYTFDDTTLVYKTKKTNISEGGEIVIFHANAKYWWGAGVPRFEKDLSSCDYSFGVCKKQDTTGRGNGNQTVFKLTTG